MHKLLASVSCLMLVSFAASGAGAATLPRKALELQINTVNGKPLVLSQYHGKPVVLAFILTGCSHCQFTTGLLVKAQSEFAAKGLQVLECAVNPDADRSVAGFVQQFHANFPVGYNFDQDFLLEKFIEHPMNAVPHMPILMFIDRTGTIRAQYEGMDGFMADEKQEQNIRAEIQKLLAPSGGAARKSAGSR
jgi:peroxiredoxin